MANVITQFLIGIGYQYDDKGERQAKAGMESIKSSTLAIGSALGAAAIGAGVRVDQLAEKSRKLQDTLYRTNTSTTWVQGYGAAMTELGGNADDAVNRVTGLEQRLAAIKMGDMGWVDSLGPAGFNSGELAQAKSAQDFITKAAEQFSRATHTQQVNMAAVLGLTDAEFKLWQQGGRYVDEHSAKLAEQLGYTESLNQKQYEYSQSWVELNLELDKAGNTISNIMLPGMTGLVERAKDFVGTINQFAKDNPEETKNIIQGGAAVGIGAGILTGGKILSKVPGLGALGRFAGPVGAATGGGFWANEEWDKIMEDSDNWYGKETTGGGNFKRNSPLGKAWDFSSEWAKSLWADLSAPPPMLQQNDRHRINVERNQRGESTLPSSYQRRVTLSETNKPTSQYDNPMPFEQVYPLSYWGETPPVQQKTTTVPYRSEGVPEKVYPLSYWDKPTRGEAYSPSSMMATTNDYREQNDHLARTLREAPIQVNNKVNLNAKVELDGRQIGQVIDDRIDEHNQQSMSQFDTQVDR